MTVWPWLGLLAAAAGLRLARRLPPRVQEFLSPASVTLALVSRWQLASEVTHADVFPTPRATALAFGELVESQRIWGDIIASLFRVTWGFLLAAYTSSHERRRLEKNHLRFSSRLTYVQCFGLHRRSRQ